MHSVYATFKSCMIITVRLKGTTHIAEKIISIDKWWLRKIAKRHRLYFF